jgi:nucleotide-binding universal stress UspA family protein
MTSPILLCTDGSDEALRALSAGLDLLGRDHDLVVVSVMEGPDEAALVGSGHAGPDMSVDEFNDQVAQSRETANRAIEEAQNELKLVGAEVHVVSGHPGEAICQLATDLSARAVVLGSRGRGGLKRLFLGSISDHVVRNAPCSVVVTRS